MSIRLLLLALVVGGCSMAHSPSPDASAAVDGPPASSERSPPPFRGRPLPSRFPVLPGAVSIPMPEDDPGLIGLWESDRVGSAAYNFYVSALPEAGYPIVGLYPGGEVAVIRFRVAEGEIWQMVAHSTPDGRLAIEVRLDRP